MPAHTASHLLWVVDGLGYTCKATATTGLQALAKGARLLSERFPKAVRATVHVRPASAEETAAFIASEEAEGITIPPASLMRSQAAGMAIPEA